MLFREIKELGFDEKFIRTWEYYFDYCAAGFKSHTLGNYQVKYRQHRTPFEPLTIISFYSMLYLSSEGKKNVVFPDADRVLSPRE